MDNSVGLFQAWLQPEPSSVLISLPETATGAFSSFKFLLLKIEDIN